MMLHGFSASGASQYSAFSGRLLPHVRRIVLPDLPGHGQSTVPADGLVPASMLDALVAILDATIDEPAVVFASSMSGGLAVQAARCRPTKVRALVLCSPSGAPFSLAELDQFQKTFSVNTHRDALAFIDRLAPRSAPDSMTLPGLLGEFATRHAYAWGLRRQWQRPHFVELLRRVPELPSLRPDELRSLAMPVYVIWGEKDDILPPSQAAYYRAHLPPSSTMETPPHFGHTPYLHHSAELAERLLAFLRRV